MKKILSLFLLAIMLTTTTVPVLAEENELSIIQTTQAEDGSTVILYDDGSMLYISPIKISESSISPLATAKTISADRVATLKDSDGITQWKYTLYGTFSYVYGVSSTCTKASYTQEIYDSDWKFSDGAATKSGNVAIGNGLFSRKILFVVTQKYNIDISLTCDIYGNIT